MLTLGMPSQSKSDTARANGAKSRGPVTPEGKAKSSRNALKHGLTASIEALPGESQQDLDDLLEAHRSAYRPVGALEEELVRTLTVTRWRLRRIAVLESEVLDIELCQSEEDLEEEFSEIEDLGRLGFVFRKLADGSQVLALLIRYESALTRTVDRTFKHLLAIQKLRNEPKPPGPEPTSDIVHPRQSMENNLPPVTLSTAVPNSRSRSTPGSAAEIPPDAPACIPARDGGLRGRACNTASPDQPAKAVPSRLCETSRPGQSLPALPPASLGNGQRSRSIPHAPAAACRWPGSTAPAPSGEEQ